MDHNNKNSNDYSDLEGILSKDRLKTYLKRTGGDESKAITLYAWHTAISGAFYAVLQALEIALRNKINDELKRKYGEEWDEDKTILFSDYHERKIEEYHERKRREYERKRREYDRGKIDKVEDEKKIVSSLPFGFWVSLIAGWTEIDGKSHSYYKILWNEDLGKIFPNRPEGVSFDEIRKYLIKFKNLRNRIAHHQPIFHRDHKKDYRNILKKDYQDLLRVLWWISKEKHQWVENHSRIPELLAQKGLTIKF